MKNPILFRIFSFYNQNLELHKYNNYKVREHLKSSSGLRRGQPRAATYEGTEPKTHSDKLFAQRWAQRVNSPTAAVFYFFLRQTTGSLTFLRPK